MSCSNNLVRRNLGSTIAFFGAILLAFFANTETISAQNPSVAEAAKFAGSWETEFGLMTLSVEGTIVVGTYDGENSIDGRVEGRRLVFTYREKTARGEGWFEISADGRSLAGRWRQAGSEALGDWTGKKVDVVPTKPSFVGSWSTSFGRLRLRQNGDRVEGTYTYGGGSRIEGKVVDGKTLVATYSEPDGTVGRATFKLTDDGRRFAGVWKAGKDLPPLAIDAPNVATWVGERIVPVAGRVWLIVLEAHWEADVSEKEYSYGSMLRAFFERVPNVSFRHRFFHDQPDLERFIKECAQIEEPVCLYISSHGTPEGVVAGGKTIDGKVIGKALADLGNLKLLHLGGCSLLAGDMAKTIRASSAPLAGFPISGYTRNVDWAGSALVDFTYLDLVLEKNIAPKTAVAETRKMLSFAGSTAPQGSVIPCTDLVIDVP